MNWRIKFPTPTDYLKLRCQAIFGGLAGDATEHILKEAGAGAACHWDPVLVATYLQVDRAAEMHIVASLQADAVPADSVALIHDAVTGRWASRQVPQEFLTPIRKAQGHDC